MAASVWNEQVKKQKEVSSKQLLTTETGLMSPQQAHSLEGEALLERRDFFNPFNCHQQNNNQVCPLDCLVSFEEPWI